jgi:acyl carrier protein
MRRVDEIIAESLEIKVADVDDSKNLADYEVWDSMTHMILINNIEEEYNIQLTGEEIVMMNSVARIKLILKNKNIEA